MFFISIKLIHLFSVFIYGGFLFTDRLFLAKLQKEYSQDEHKKVRESFMKYVRKVVPPALIVAVVSGMILFAEIFGPIGSELSRFQILLLLKASLGLWLGLRGALQVYFKIDPFVFKSHKLPFILVVTIIALSQLLYL